MKEVGVSIVALMVLIFLFKLIYDADQKWEREHALQCAEWERQATTADMKVQVQMTCAKIAQDRANAAQISAAAMTAGSMAAMRK